MHRTCHNNVNQLKASVSKEWFDMSEDNLTSVCRAYRNRVQIVVAAECSHFD